MNDASKVASDAPTMSAVMMMRSVRSVLSSGNASRYPVSYAADVHTDAEVRLAVGGELLVARLTPSDRLTEFGGEFGLAESDSRLELRLRQDREPAGLDVEIDERVSELPGTQVECSSHAAGMVERLNPGSRLTLLDQRTLDDRRSGEREAESGEERGEPEKSVTRVLRLRERRRAIATVLPTNRFLM